MTACGVSIFPKDSSKCMGNKTCAFTLKYKLSLCCTQNKNSVSAQGLNRRAILYRRYFGSSELKRTMDGSLYGRTFLRKEERECWDLGSGEMGRIKEFSPLSTRELKDENEF